MLHFLSKTIARKSVEIKNKTKNLKENTNMKVTVIGRTFVVESNYTKAEIAKAATYRPESLILRDAKENAIYAIAVGTNGSFTNNGLIYNQENGAGKAIYTGQLPDGVEAKKYLAEKFGGALVKAKSIEAGLATVISGIDGEMAEVMSSITVA